MQEADRTRQGTPETPNSHMLPLQGQTWGRGPRGEHRAGLSSGSRVQNAGGDEGLAGCRPPLAVSAPGAGPRPMGTNTTEAPALPHRQGPARPPLGRRAFLRNRGGQEGVGGARRSGLARVSWELTRHLRAGRAGHPEKTDPSDIKTKTHTHSGREASGAVRFWIKPKISVKFLLGTGPSQLHLPRLADT